MVALRRRTGRAGFLPTFDDRAHGPVELRGKPSFHILQYEEPLVDGFIYYDNRFWRSPRGHQEVPLRTFEDVVAVVEGETAKCAAIWSSRLHTRAAANEARISGYNELVRELDQLHAEARVWRYGLHETNVYIQWKERELTQLGTLIPTRFPLRL